MFNVGNGSDESNQIIQRVPRTDSTPNKANVQCYNCNEKGHYARDFQKPKVSNAKYFREQMLLAMKDEAGSHVSNEENDFMLDNAYGEELLDELTASVMLMARLQPADETTDTVHHMMKRFYQNPERLKKAIAAQPKMYDGDMLHSDKLKIHSLDSKETLEDAEESQNKIKDKMIQVNYDKINRLYETFVPQQELSAEQTYFSIPSTSNNSSESKDIPSESPVLKMPNESRLLKKIDKLGDALSGFYTKISKTLLKDAERRWLFDSQNELREFYKTDVIPTLRSLYTNLQNIKEELIEEVQEMSNIFKSVLNNVLLSDAKQTHDLLKDELEKSSNDSKEIQANLLHRIKILENDFQRTQAQTYVYGDVRAENQDLLMTIYKLKNKLCTIEKGKNVNTKFDSSKTLGKRCVARHALSRKSSVKRALFSSPLAMQSKHLGATFVVNKSRLSVATTPTTISKAIQLVLWIVNSGCSKHMTGLGHNSFSVGQFCDGDLEVAFRSNTCYVRNLEGDDLLTGSRDSNLYTISISKMAASSPVCLMSRATSTKSWLWHRRLSHLNFGTINQLTSNDLVDGLPKFKYTKYHLCSAYKQGKSKKASLPPKLVPSTESKLELHHMDLCGPMRVASIIGKKYILVIIDDYSWYTWVYFLRTKYEAPDMIIDFVNQVQRNLKAQILTIRTDNGTEFKNE
ncbi:retrovirus-related pol polyprotein from transposon TNT 1-94 [Tanacetum coccineum]